MGVEEIIHLERFETGKKLPENTYNHDYFWTGEEVQSVNEAQKDERLSKEK